MKLTSQEEYGLRCLLRVGREAGGADGSRSLTIPEVARAEGIYRLRPEADWPVDPEADELPLGSPSGLPAWRRPLVV